MAGGRKTARPLSPPKQWRPRRAVRNFLALHSLRYRKPNVTYRTANFDAAIYNKDNVRIAHVVASWNDVTIIAEIEYGMERARDA